VFFPSELGAANDAMDGGRYAEAGSLYEGAAAESRAAGDIAGALVAAITSDLPTFLFVYLPSGHRRRREARRRRRRCSSRRTGGTRGGSDR
jgi:hypothetical protein